MTSHEPDRVVLKHRIESEAIMHRARHLLAEIPPHLTPHMGLTIVPDEGNAKPEILILERVTALHPKESLGRSVEPAAGDKLSRTKLLPGVGNVMGGCSSVGSVGLTLHAVGTRADPRRTSARSMNCFVMTCLLSGHGPSRLRRPDLATLGTHQPSLLCSGGYSPPASVSKAEWSFALRGDQCQSVSASSVERSLSPLPLRTKINPWSKSKSFTRCWHASITRGRPPS